MTSPEIRKKYEEMAEAGMKRLHPDKPKLIFGYGTCGLAAGCGCLVDIAKEIKGVDHVTSHVGCIGLCHVEPLVDVQLPGMPRVTYASVDQEKLKVIIEKHLIGGQPVKELAYAQLATELSVIKKGAINYPKKYDGIPTYQELPFFKRQMRIALRNCGIIDPESLEEYMARGGYRAAYKALHGMTPEEVIEDVTISNIRGRGGAGFPTGTKWGFCRGSKGDVKYLICNADEGDPGAYANRAVLEGDPHSIIEGMVIGAYAMGATRGYIYVRAEYPLAVQRLRLAIKQARQHCILGTNIMGTDFSFDISIFEGAGAFVCGEEIALIASIEGKRGEPRPRPPFPAVSGVFGKPTNINNVETLATIPMIIQRGGYWFASIGTERSKGTKVFSLVGKIKRSGLVEVPMGISLGVIIHEMGGGMLDDKGFKAVQTGGPSGGCIPENFLETEIDYESLKKLGSIMGSGGMVALDEDTCMVDVAKFFLNFTSSESCGKCTPCRVGGKRMLDILDKISKGKGTKEDLVTLEHLAIQVRDASLCALGGTSPNPVLTTLRYFRNEYEEHIEKGGCKNTCKKRGASKVAAPSAAGKAPKKTDAPKKGVSK